MFLVVVISLSFVFALMASAMTVKDAPQVEDYISYVASHEGVNVSLAMAIAKAESGFQPNAKNPVGSASGVFQFLDSTFRNYCINKFHMTNSMGDKNRPTIQVNCAIEMLKEPLGYMHWFASMASWGHLLTS